MLNLHITVKLQVLKKGRKKWLTKIYKYDDVTTVKSLKESVYTSILQSSPIRRGMLNHPGR